MKPDANALETEKDKKRLNDDYCQKSAQLDKKKEFKTYRENELRLIDEKQNKLDQERRGLHQKHCSKLPIILCIIFSITTIASVSVIIVGYFYYNSELSSLKSALSNATYELQDVRSTLIDTKAELNDYKDDNITFSEWYTVWSQTIEGRRIIYNYNKNDSSFAEWSKYFHEIYNTKFSNSPPW